jgi:hypothetical protein
MCVSVKARGCAFSAQCFEHALPIAPTDGSCWQHWLSVHLDVEPKPSQSISHGCFPALLLIAHNT